MKLLILGTTVQAGKCPFGYGSSAETKAPGDEHVLSEIEATEQALSKYKYPYDLIKCKGNPVMKTAKDHRFNTHVYRPLFLEIINHMDNTLKVPEKKREFAACLARFVGHDVMDFRRWDKNMGGVDACLDFDDPDNKGLRACLHKINIEKFYQKWCHKVSLADYLTMASEAALTDLSTSIWE